MSLNSNLSNPPETDAKTGSVCDGLRATRFDRVTSFLMALMLLIGTAVSVLMLLWMLDPTREFDHEIEAARPSGGAAEAADLEVDFESPGTDEIAALLEPTLQDVISAVKQAANVEDVLDASLAGSSKTEAGSPGPRNPGPEAPEIVPRFERWQLNFVGNDVRTYAQQLDFYQIELGVVGGAIQGVDLVNQLSTQPVARRIVDTASEKRLYFIWTHPTPLARFDRQLLSRAGVRLEERQMLKFVPFDLENHLAKIELEYAVSSGYQSVTAIAKTIFESKPAGGQYRFEVIDQRYR